MLRERMGGTPTVPGGQVGVIRCTARRLPVERDRMVRRRDCRAIRDWRCTELHRRHRVARQRVSISFVNREENGS